jgi:hypothetical protein
VLPRQAPMTPEFSPFSNAHLSPAYCPLTLCSSNPTCLCVGSWPSPMSIPHAYARSQSMYTSYACYADERLHLSLVSSPAVPYQNKDTKYHILVCSQGIYFDAGWCVTVLRED